MQPKPAGGAPGSPESRPAAPSNAPSPPRSPTHKPKASRNPSISSIGRKDHAPHHPSGLRQSARPGESSSPESSRGGAVSSREHTGKRPNVPGEEVGIHSPDGYGERARAEEDFSEYNEETHSLWSGQTNEPNAHTRLLGDHNWDSGHGCGDDNCRHGSFSIRPTSPRQGSLKSYNTFRTDLSDEGFGGPFPEGTGSGIDDAADVTHGILGDTIADELLGGGDGNKTSTTNHLARRHGIRARRKMYAISAA